MTRLPNSWARQHRAVLTQQQGVGTLVISERTPDWALVELRRRYPELDERQVPDAELDTWIA